MQKHLLSKSTFIRGLQCEKSLYLYTYYKDLRDPISENQQALFNRGHKVGELAWTLFPDGIDARPANKFNTTQAIRKTENLIKKGTPTLFEPTFRANQVLVMVDILHQQNGKWYAYEVKSSTKVNQNQIRDASLQYYVLKLAGIEPSDFFIIYINKQYRRKDALNLREFFTKESVLNKALENQPFVEKNIHKAKSVIAKDTVPGISIGEHCTTPYPCDFIGYCWTNVPSNSVFELGSLDKQTKFKLFNEGYQTIASIPNSEHYHKDVRIQIETHKHQEPYYHTQNLREFLENIHYPVCFLDFEAIMPAVPLFENTKPYEKIPFQYSMHCKKEQNSTTSHFEFIAEPGSDPRPTFLKQLLTDTQGVGSIVVFENNLEKNILNKFKALYPEKGKQIDNRLNRMVDLRNPFKRMDYYHPEMNGNFDLKAIYKALTGLTGEEAEEIEHGGIASVIYEHLLTETEPVKIAEQKEQLLAYCKSDTYALVKILESLEKIVKE